MFLLSKLLIFYQAVLILGLNGASQPAPPPKKIPPNEIERVGSVICKAALQITYYPFYAGALFRRSEEECHFLYL